ncbi:MAG: hypothetical protein ABJZ55_03060 [Fuerstiella sp.]
MLVDIFIVTLLLWFWCYDLPSDSPAKRMVRPLERPFCWLGLWHGWSMFAPDPLRVNRRLRAELQYTDGTVDEWRPVEPQRSNWFLDWLWFRYFKYQSSVLGGRDSQLYQPLCLFLIKQASEEGLTVKSVKLVREYQMVQPPHADKPLRDWQQSPVYEFKPQEKPKVTRQP